MDTKRHPRSCPACGHHFIPWGTWRIYAWILFWEWMPFGVLWWALRRSGRQWLDVGVDWSYFVRHRIVFFIAVAAFIAIAFTLPHFLYHGDVPRVSQTYSFLPVT